VQAISDACSSRDAQAGGKSADRLHKLALVIVS
jgi:hypothetical protein